MVNKLLIDLIFVLVFLIKKDYLIDLIVKQKFFGEITAFVYVIEFQKRGLSHISYLKYKI